jgi:hypothetical protein
VEGDDLDAIEAARHIYDRRAVNDVSLVTAM